MGTRTREVNFPPVDIEVREGNGGALYMRSRRGLGEVAEFLCDPLARWAREAPERLWLAERPLGEARRAGVWRELRYGEALGRVEALALGLRGMGLRAGRTLAILSENSIDHALITYAAHLAGSPAAPVSTAYSLMSTDYGKLKHVFGLVKPYAVYVEGLSGYEGALEALRSAGHDFRLIVSGGGGGDATLEELEALGSNGVGLEDMYEGLDRDMPAKYLFTSGSTGAPKAVELTHKMMTTNAAMIRAVSEQEAPPQVQVSWLPWNHIYGGNAVLNGTLTMGGTLYLDGGRPAPGRFEETLDNLREISPTVHSTVPLTYTMLVEVLERDEGLARTFFKRLKVMMYGGAAISQDVRRRMNVVMDRVLGERVSFLSGYGATETSPTAMTVHWTGAGPEVMGLPVPGVELKLCPLTEGRYELRIRGDSIMKRYYGNEKRTKEAFDEEGFYCLGDAVRFEDDGEVEKGLVFAGRVAENFKLDTGVWVHVGTLRLEVLKSLDGLLTDAALTGLNKGWVGLMGFLNMEVVRARVGDEGLSWEEACEDERVLGLLKEGLEAHNEVWKASSTRIGGALLLKEPPSMDAGEMTDKGYVNQGACLSRRAGEVERLYEGGAGIIRL